MSWATFHIEALSNQEAVEFRPRGHSMTPTILDGQLVRVEAPSCPIVVGAIVLCTVRGRDYLHKVKAVGPRGYLIANAKGRENGWTRQIHGVVTRIGELS